MAKIILMCHRRRYLDFLCFLLFNLVLESIHLGQVRFDQCGGLMSSEFVGIVCVGGLHSRVNKTWQYYAKLG